VRAGARVFVAGSTTLAGQALVRRLGQEAFELVGLGADEPDLHDVAGVDRFFFDASPELVFVAAGAQAGIAGNQQHPADLLLDNLRVASSVIPAAARHQAALLYLGSSCVYPKAAPQPFAIDALGSGPLEPTSAAYAQAKLAGMALVDAYRRQHGSRFIAAIPADVYGPGDDFTPDGAHVAAALLRRIHDARETGAPSIEIWGSGKPRREFLYVDDLADACVLVMRQYTGDAPINIGTGMTTSIAELADVICEIVGYQGNRLFNTSRPDGMPLKGLDSTPLRDLGWRPTWTLRAGLERTYEWFKSVGNLRT
jgi:GDP-L-fucose synthase